MRERLVDNYNLSIMMDESGEEILASMYENQVAGHHCIISYHGYVLKPYNDCEANMYSLIPIKYPALAPFIPKFHGILDLASTMVAPVLLLPKSFMCKPPVVPAPTSVARGILLSSQKEFNRGPKKENQKIGVEEDKTVSPDIGDSEKERWLTKLYNNRYDNCVTSNFFQRSSL